MSHKLVDNYRVDSSNREKTLRYQIWIARFLSRFPRRREKSLYREQSSHNTHYQGSAAGARETAIIADRFYW